MKSFLLTIAFGQIVDADDVVFRRVKLDLGLGLERHFCVDLMGSVSFVDKRMFGGILVWDQC